MGKNVGEMRPILEARESIAAPKTERVSSHMMGTPTASLQADGAAKDEEFVLGEGFG